MQRAWIVVLAGCSFKSSVGASDGGSSPGTPTGDGPGPDGMIDAAQIIDAMPDAYVTPPPCVSSTHAAFGSIACALALPPPLTVMQSTQVDTDSTGPNTEGLRCAPLTVTSADVCAIAADSITIPTGVIVAAHGTRPLVLLAHTIEIEGTVDVASHTGRTPGAASEMQGCQNNLRAVGSGGGQGGTFNAEPGGPGGAGTGMNDTGGPITASTGIGILRGGCPGGPSSDTTVVGNVARAGGAVWIAVDGDGVLTLGSTAIINASGAGGPRGEPTAGHRGGFGGGSGGLIVLQAATLMLDANAQIFANGGGGGGGADGTVTPGSPGADPVAATSVPGGGAGATANPAAGGAGFPAPVDQRKGDDAIAASNGGGGGGGGAGVILTDVGITVGPGIFSPPPTDMR